MAAGALRSAVAAPGQLALQSVAIPAPLVLPLLGTEGAAVSMLHCSLDAATGAITVTSEGASGRTQTHFTAEAACIAAGAAPAEVRKARRLPRLAAVLRGRAPAPTPHRAGSIASLALPAQADGHTYHPSSLDCTFQLGAVQTAPGAAPQLRVPAAIAFVTIGEASAVRSATAWAAAAVARAATAELVLDYGMASADASAVVGCVQGLVARALAAVPAQPATAAAALQVRLRVMPWQKRYK